MVEPAWRRMLDAALEYKEAKEVLTVLSQLGHRNLTADHMISKIHVFSSQSQNIYDYTELVLKECRISDAEMEEFIEEIQAKN